MESYIFVSPKVNRSPYQGMLFTFGLFTVKLNRGKAEQDHRSWWISPAGEFLCCGYLGD
ncbi:hypothetical protein ACLIJR_18150 [Hydrogenophaga sp. XSHU_21]